MEPKLIYVNSRLRSLPVGLSAPREWIFSLGDKWLLLTPPRLLRLAALPGLEDIRVARILADVRRWHPHPEHFCRPLGLEETPPPASVRDRDRALDKAARERLLELHPGDFEDGVLRPNWRNNKLRRLQRDWKNAVNRILLGDHYRPVAKEYGCSVGLLHRKVTEAKYWEWN